MKVYEVTTREIVYREYRVERVYTIEAADEEEAKDKAEREYQPADTVSEEFYAEDRDRGNEEVTDCEDVTPETECSFCWETFPEDEIKEHEKDCGERE